MSNKKILSWGDVACAATIACRFDDYGALEWIWQAWEILIQAGLATYLTKIEICEVVIRFLALVSFYFEFSLGCDWYNYYGYDYLEWAEAIVINNFQAEQIFVYAQLCSPVQDEDEDKREDELDHDKLLHLIEHAREEVIAALIEGFGSQTMLFASLQQSKQPEIQEYEEFDKNYYFYQTETEILNNSDYNFYQVEADEILQNDILAYQMATWKQIYEPVEENDENNIFFENEISDGVIMPENTATDLKQVDEVATAAKQLAQLFNKNIAIIEGDNNHQYYIQLISKLKPRYSASKCADKTGFKEAKIEKWLKAIERKKQAILYGSPGTGKTYVADKVAKHLIGGGDGFLELVQFHPAYSYEDFIQGIRPQSQDGELKYPLVPGRFLQFCKKAESRQDTCVLIIDEINRANLAQVFGELMYLLEYRDRCIPLAAGGTLRIPENVRIIGTMNTADRSIALIDNALRRRFAFIELRPNYKVLERYHQKTGFPVKGLIQTLERLNQAIADKHHEIGISFFLTEHLADQIEDIWSMEIEPYLEDYFFDQPDKVDEFRWEKISKTVSP